MGFVIENPVIEPKKSEFLPNPSFMIATIFPEWSAYSLKNCNDFFDILRKDLGEG